MKHFLLFLTFICSINGTSQSLDTIKQFNYKSHFELILKETKKVDSKYSYSKQLRKFLNYEDQSHFEVLTMLIGYTDDTSYNPYFDIFLDQEIFDLNEERKFEEAIEKGNKILEKKPFLIKILREVSYAYDKTGKSDLALKYLEKTGKIYNAMFYSSATTGVHIDDAMFALNPKDGQYFIRYFAQSKLGDMGSGQDKNGYFIDILETTLDNKPVVLYFNVEHAIKIMKDKLNKD